MKPLKVLHIIRPAEGGMKEHLLALIKGIDQQKYVFHVACPGDSPVARDLQAIGIEVTDIPLEGPIHPVKDAKCIRQLRKLCADEGYPLVHCHGSKAGLVGRAAANLAGVPAVIMTAHNFVIGDNLSKVKKFIFTAGEQVLGGRTNHIITVSEALKNEYVTRFGVPAGKITCIYNGIDTGAFSAKVDTAAVRKTMGLPTDKLIVGTVARMAPQKGLKHFVAAIATMGDRLDAHYLIAGDGPLRGELEAQAKDLGVREKIMFPGFCQNINEVLKVIDIFVVPSVSEGLSITAIEAMAAGRPVIASRVGGLPEVVADGQTGILVPAGDSDGLADAIMRLGSDKALAHKMGQNGVVMAGQKFSIDGMITATEGLYNRILGI